MPKYYDNPTLILTEVFYNMRIIGKWMRRMGQGDIFLLSADFLSPVQNFLLKYVFLHHDFQYVTLQLYHFIPVLLF